MEWLKDKKNLPIVAALGVIVLIGAIVAVLFETGVIGGSPAATTAATTTASSGYPGGYPGAVGAPGGAPPPAYPGASGYPGATGGFSGYPGAGGFPGAVGAAPLPAAPGPAKVTGPVNVAKGPDPFYVAGLAKAGKGSVGRLRPPAPRVSAFVPPVYIASIGTRSTATPGAIGGVSQTSLPVPNILLTPEESRTMRVSGVVMTGSDGIRAVLEANGQSLTVQPGETVQGGKVISIQSDGLTLKGSNGRLVHVPLGGGGASGGGGGYTNGYAGGGYPGFPGGYPGGYPGG